MQKLLDGIANLEKRAGISVRDYLGFGDDSNAVIKYSKRCGTDCIGEMNSDNKLHGRGIDIDSDGNIYIGYFDNGSWYAPGKNIEIHGNGGFLVGEL